MDVIQRSSIMRCFTPEESKLTNQMWVNVRCYNLKKLPPAGWILVVAFVGAVAFAAVQKVRRRRHQSEAGRRQLERQKKD
ncbi:MAG: hypothetical protein PUE63_04035, partial [Lachnospiraceae bacterium]|nr:hypothetical protein [Lachnospiraceae bacterium]